MTNYKEYSSGDLVKYNKEVTFTNMWGHEQTKPIIQQGYIITICNENGIMKAIVGIGNDRFGLVTCDYVNVEELEILNG